MIFYYKKNDNSFRIYDTDKKQFETVDKLTFGKGNIYYVFKGYDSDEKILEFIDKFHIWCKELKESTKIDYKRFKSHIGAIPLIVKNLCKHFDEFEDIDQIESGWLEKCCKSYQHILTKKGISNCYGYDFKAFYLSIMGMPSLHYDIPVHKGREHTLTSLNFYKLDIGMYHVKITSNDKRFLFHYSQHNVYTNISLYYAYKCKMNGLDVSIELVQDDQPNAYLYGRTTKEGVHSSRYMFGYLYDTLMLAKCKYPKNGLVKFICSAIWGHLSEFNTKNFTLDEIIEQDLDVVSDKHNKNADYYIEDFNGKYYKCVNIKKIYKYNCARMKPFLLSMGRNISSNVASLYIDDVVRIHTDGLVFSKQHDDIMTRFKTYPELLPEDKTTGLIDWAQENDYFNLTLNEKHGKYKYSKENQYKQLQIFHAERQK
jgi:hypothetical protein